MLTRITGGEIIDPVNGRSGHGDLWLRDGHIAAPPTNEAADRTIDATDCISIPTSVAAM